MIVYEIVKMHIVAKPHVSLAFDRVCYLKVVVIVVSAVKSLVQCIICHGVQGIVIYPSAVLSVYDLSHQPEVILQTVRDTPEFTHESLFEHIRGIQANAVDIEFRYPETHSVKMILSHLRLIQIELWKQIVSSPVLIGKAIVILVISPEIYIAVPVFVPAVLTVFLQIAEGEESSSAVIEHAVQDNTYTILMAVSYQILKIFIVSQSLIEPAVVLSVISVRSG